MSFHWYVNTLGYKIRMHMSSPYATTCENLQNPNVFTLKTQTRSRMSADLALQTRGVADETTVAPIAPDNQVNLAPNSNYGGKFSSQQTLQPNVLLVDPLWIPDPDCGSRSHL